MVVYVLEQKQAIPSWPDQIIASKIHAFDFNNPLGVSRVVHWLVVLYLPFLVLVAVSLNMLALRVLHSNFLKFLVIQPLLSSLLYLQFIMLMFGPFYVWLLHCMHIYIGRHQLYTCFLLLWGHNFAAVAISSVMVAIIIERALSIGKPELMWGIWQRSCRHTTRLLLIFALILAVGGFLSVNYSQEIRRPGYPVCLPWWDNEHGSASPLWYKILAFNFSLGPSLMILLALIFLTSAVNRFSRMMRCGVDTLNHYSALYLEIRSTLHLKFVRSAWWLGLLFVVTSCPLGFFVVFGPAINHKIGLDKKMPESLTVYPKDAVLSAYPVDQDEEGQNLTITDADQPFAPGDYTYLLVSRSDCETLLWITYYSFTLLTVPVLLSTEILFRRECRGRLRLILAVLRCRDSTECNASRWSWLQMYKINNRDLVGPYVAQSCEHLPAPRAGLGSRGYTGMRVYDASRLERAGRGLGMFSAVSGGTPGTNSSSGVPADDPGNLPQRAHYAKAPKAALNSVTSTDSAQFR